MQLAIFQPDIPQNVGTLLRLSACMAIPLHIIEPCGFPWDDKKIRRAGMDYIAHTNLTRHTSWEAFEAWHHALSPSPRLILLTTKTNQRYTDFQFLPSDILLLGKESAGVPPQVHQSADAAVTIPMAQGMRSLNVAISGAMVLGEALRQTIEFPKI